MTTFREAASVALSRAFQTGLTHIVALMSSGAFEVLTPEQYKAADDQDLVRRFEGFAGDSIPSYVRLLGFNGDPDKMPWSPMARH